MRRPAIMKRGKASIRRRGFTLIELVVVMAIIGILAAMLAPKLPDVGGWRMKSAARKLANSIGAVYSKAATSKLVYRLTVDMAENGYYVSILNTDGEFEKKDVLLAKETKLPDGMSFESVQIPGQGKLTEGQAHIHFFPMGMAEYAAIHIRGRGDMVMTLTVAPLTGRVEIADEYKEIGGATLAGRM